MPTTFRLLSSLLLIGSLAATFGCSRTGPAMAQAAPAGNMAARMAIKSTGNQVQLLVDAPEIFDSMVLAIQGAKSSIQLEIYQLGGDVGMRIVDAILARRAAGVQVQILVDPSHGGAGVGKQQNKRCLDALQQAGVIVRDYNTKGMPKGPTWLSSLGVIDHAKVLVIDGEVAFAGGMNFYDLGVVNHDYMVRVAGPGASHLGEMINDDWRHSGPEAGIIAVRLAAPRGDAQVEVAQTSPTKRNIRTTLIEKFNAAQRRIWVEVLFLDDDAIINALAAAKNRGVDVRVILDPLVWGKHVPELERLPFNGIPNWSAVNRLLAEKVAVYWHNPTTPEQNLHAKIAMVDDRSVMIGSANYTYRALDRNREVALAVESPETAARFAQVFLEDEARAMPVPPLSNFQLKLASLFDLVKRGIYREDRDLPKAEQP